MPARLLKEAEKWYSSQNPSLCAMVLTAMAVSRSNSLASPNLRSSR